MPGAYFSVAHAAISMASNNDCKIFAGRESAEGAGQNSSSEADGILLPLLPSGHERKCGDVCGEEFAAQARRERRAYPVSGSVRSEQRRLGRKEPPPGGLRPIWPGASLLVGHSPTGGGCSLLAPRPRPNGAQQTTPDLRS